MKTISGVIVVLILILFTSVSNNAAAGAYFAGNGQGYESSIGITSIPRGTFINISSLPEAYALADHFCLARKIIMDFTKNFWTKIRENGLS